MLLRRFAAALTFVALALVCLPRAAQPQDDNQIPSIEEKTAGMTQMEGFFDLYWDENTGKMFVEFDKLDVEFLYAVSLAAGCP